MQTDLLNFLSAQIPITKSLGFTIEHADFKKVVLKAPLTANHNHMGTAFGGSISMLLILSGYTWLYHRLNQTGFDYHVILKKSDVDYLLPITEDMLIVCESPGDDELENFLKVFEVKGKAKIKLSPIINSSNGIAARMVGEFLAVTIPD